MPEKPGWVTHFAGLIRIVVVIVVVGFLAFLFVRFASQRRNVVTVNEQPPRETTSEQREEKQSEDKDQESRPTPTEDAPIPRGVADSEVIPESGPSSNIPAAGMGTDILITMVVLTFSAFLSRQYMLQREQLLRS